MSQPAIDFARTDDARVLEALIERSARALCIPDYTAEQVSSALGSVWGLDRQLLDDRTYFAVRVSSEIVACGGWSWRRKLFGADSYVDLGPGVLQPPTDAARIRAFFVCPRWVRKGLGREILLRCEADAKALGFDSAELMATLPGTKLYAACGYVPRTPKAFLLPGGQTINFIPMTKQLSRTTGEPNPR